MTEKENSTETMSHIQIRKLIERPTNYAGRSWFYEFRFIPVHCQEKAVIKTCNNLFQCIAPITKNWNDAKNSEWISRIYFAAKMILSATVMWQSLEFAIDKNLRPVSSYLEYYTVFHTLRAILLTNPQTQWNDGKFSFSDGAIQRICNVEIEGFNFYDYEDNYRMRYLQRKHPLPTNIRFIMSEGHVEDFLGAWCTKEKAEGQFNPDDNWRIIFDVP